MFTLPEVAKGSGVLPTEPISTVPLGSPGRPPTMSQDRRCRWPLKSSSCWCWGPVAMAQPHPGAAPRALSCALLPTWASGWWWPSPARWDGRILGPASSCPAQQSGSGALALSLSSVLVFGGLGTCKLALGRPVGGSGSGQDSFLCKSGPPPPTFLRHNGVTCPSVPALGCSRPPGDAKMIIISHNTGGAWPL